MDERFEQFSNFSFHVEPCIKIMRIKETLRSETYISTSELEVSKNPHDELRRIRITA